MSATQHQALQVSHFNGIHDTFLSIIQQPGFTGSAQGSPYTVGIACTISRAKPQLTGYDIQSQSESIQLSCCHSCSELCFVSATAVIKLLLFCLRQGKSLLRTLMHARYIRLKTDGFLFHLNDINSFPNRIRKKKLQKVLIF